MLNSRDKDNELTPVHFAVIITAGAGVLRTVKGKSMLYYAMKRRVSCKEK